MNSAGEDVTAQYQKCAETALHIAERNGAKVAILKARSPFYGKGLICDSTFSGSKIPGNGITAQLLTENGIAVFTEDELDAVTAFLNR